MALIFSAYNLGPFFTLLIYRSFIINFWTVYSFDLFSSQVLFGKIVFVLLQLLFLETWIWGKVFILFPEDLPYSGFISFLPVRGFRHGKLLFVQCGNRKPYFLSWLFWNWTELVSGKYCSLSTMTASKTPCMSASTAPTLAPVLSLSVGDQKHTEMEGCFSNNEISRNTSGRKTSSARKKLITVWFSIF